MSMVLYIFFYRLKKPKESYLLLNWQVMIKKWIQVWLKELQIVWIWELKKML